MPRVKAVPVKGNGQANAASASISALDRWEQRNDVRSHGESLEEMDVRIHDDWSQDEDDDSSDHEDDFNDSSETHASNKRTRVVLEQEDDEDDEIELHTVSGKKKLARQKWTWEPLVNNILDKSLKRYPLTPLSSSSCSFSSSIYISLTNNQGSLYVANLSQLANHNFDLSQIMYGWHIVLDPRSKVAPKMDATSLNTLNLHDTTTNAHVGIKMSHDILKKLSTSDIKYVPYIRENNDLYIDILLSTEDTNKFHFLEVFVLAYGSQPIDMATLMKDIPIPQPSTCFTLETLLDDLAANSIDHTANYTRAELDMCDRQLKNNGIITKLRDYQLRGVIWMLSREQEDDCLSMKPITAICDDVGGDDRTLVLLHAMLASRPDGWTCIPLPHHNIEQQEAHVFYNIYSGELSIDPPDEMILTTGGILADMMGIGKSLQVIALCVAQKNSKHEQLQEHRTTTSSLPMSAPSSPVPSSSSSSLPSSPMRVSNLQITSQQVLESYWNSQLSSSTTVSSSEAIDGDQSSSSGSSRPTRRAAQVNKNYKEPVSGKYKDKSVIVLYDKKSSTETTNRHNVDHLDYHPLSHNSSSSNVYSCFCGCEEIQTSWILCQKCRKHRHTSCCGFEDTLPESLPESFVCYSCIATQIVCLPKDSTIRPIGNTLLVIPATLISQWKDQIDFHTDRRLKVTLYLSGDKKQISSVTGGAHVKHLASEYYTNSHPFALMAHDIVITTFESLSAELDTTVSKFVGSNLNRRYEILPSPIVGIRWNRIVFDEAQEVEGNAKSKIVQMAHKLHGNHKWFVSGTPLGTGNVTDLKNIMTLLNQTPFNEEIRWSHMVEGNNQINLSNSDLLPFNAYLFMMHLKSILSRVILRRSLTHIYVDSYIYPHANLRNLFVTYVVHYIHRSQFAVEAELNLPTQLKKTKFLTFSSIEKHHYDYIEQEIMKLIASSTAGAGVKLQEYEGAGSGDKVRTEFLSTTINNHLGALRNT